ncbi:MAG: ribose 5-phosphate isomerase B [Rikenellaceae bacterium]|jgi:ribose 5-phosphate isomerase B|nr:ribose 5-phosphate isomerase B [Rikenellaceae bacterium]MBO5873766.1 ribose 5-phosphate isomerase B [Rikenellaceae bacterium]
MKKQITIGFACDHAGYQMKEMLVEYLMGEGYAITDFGTMSEESCDYPDFAHNLAEAVVAGKCNVGIALCGSGNGISMTLNKHRDIRAALCWQPELAKLARNHNDANVCSIPARFVDEKTAIEIVDTFLNEEFEGGRHQRRIDKINC